MKRLAVVGDSFSSDRGPHSWIDLLAKDFDIVNYSQRGISEYRLWKNIVNELQSIKRADLVVVFHTNPDRVWINDGADFPTRNLSSHRCADLVCSDSLDTDDRKWQKIVQDYYKYFHDSQQQRILYDHLRERIALDLGDIPFLELSGFDISDVISIHDIWKKHPGKVNHLDHIGNLLVHDRIRTQL